MKKYPVSNQRQAEQRSAPSSKPKQAQFFSYLSSRRKEENCFQRCIEKRRRARRRQRSDPYDQVGDQVKDIDGATTVEDMTTEIRAAFDETIEHKGVEHAIGLDTTT